MRATSPRCRQRWERHAGCSGALLAAGCRQGNSSGGARCREQTHSGEVGLGWLRGSPHRSPVLSGVRDRGRERRALPSLESTSVNTLPARQTPGIGIIGALKPCTGGALTPPKSAQRSRPSPQGHRGQRRPNPSPLGPLSQTLTGRPGEPWPSPPPERGMRRWKIPNTLRRPGFAARAGCTPMRGRTWAKRAPGLRHPPSRVPVRGGGAGQVPAAPALSAPSPRQGAAERRESAAQAAGAAGHGAAAQAVALQTPRQPLPHQDREDPASTRLPDDSGAGKGTSCPHLRRLLRGMSWMEGTGTRDSSIPSPSVT